MKTIIFPLKQKMRGQKVTNLQDVLQLLLVRGLLLRVNESTRRKLTAALKPELEKHYFGRTTARLVSIFQKEYRLEPDGEVDEATARALNELLHKQGRRDQNAQSKFYSVTGVVRQLEGDPLAEIVVRAFDQGLRRRQLLGEVKTTADGRYSIRYDQDKLLDPKRGSANLVIEVVGAKGEILHTSDVHYNSRPQATVNLKVDEDAGLSEWERLSARITPALEDTAIKDINGRELTFLQKSLQIEPKQLECFVAAAKLAEQSQLPDWFHYALLHQGLPEALDKLLDLPEIRVRKAFADACETGVVVIPGGEKMVGLWHRFNGLRTEHMLDKPLAGRRSKLRQLLQGADIKTDVQAVLAEALRNMDPQNPGIWSSLAEKTGLDVGTLTRVEFAVRVAELADDHLPTVMALQQDENVQTLRDLARQYGPETWRELVDRTVQADGSDLPADVPGETVEERRAFFAQRLYKHVVKAYPDVAVTYALSRHPVLGEGRAARVLPRILEADAGFDLATARIDAYVCQHKEALDIQNEAEELAVRAELKRVQRVYRLRADPTVVSRLLEDRLDSSTAILSQGRERFIDNYGQDEGIGRSVAKAIYAQAEANAAKALGIYARFSPLINTSPRPVSVSSEDCPESLQGVPNFSSLFGSLDGCVCNPCESVYSPAAYLTDLLAFLETEIQPTANRLPAGESPKNGLEALKTRSFCDRNNQLLADKPRRPDILDIKLSCTNAETPVPYVDLVLEVLENAVKPRSNGVPQTSLGASQLAAQPEHFIPEAYGELASAVFPFDFPFDLYKEEAAIYLEKLGASRVELLEAFFPFSQGNNPHDLTEIDRWRSTTIAAAILGLSEFEWTLISGKPLVPARLASEMWGYSMGSRNWWLPLRVVDTFLERSQLSYKDLLRLLTLKSFNPSGKLTLKFEDPGDCDPRKISIDQLNAQDLEFLHRFLRLQRLLDWSLQELDQALASLSLSISQGRPALDEDFLLRLSHLQRLRDRYSLPLIEILTWWSDIDTANYGDPNLPASYSLYENLFLTGRKGEPQFDAFLLDATGSELADATQPLVEHLDAISRAVNMPLDEINRLVLSMIEPTDRQLNLVNLSILFRHASLSRALNLSVADYLMAIDLIGFDPFQKDGGLDKTLQTLRFTERVETFKQSDFSIAELDYVLRQTIPFPIQTIAPTDEWVQEALASLKKALQPLDTLAKPGLTIRQALEILGPGPGTTVSADDLRPLIEKLLGDETAFNQVNQENQLTAILQEVLTLVNSGTIDQASIYSKLTAVEEMIEAALRQVLSIGLGEVLRLPSETCMTLLQQIPVPSDATEMAGTLLLNAFKFPAAESDADTLIPDQTSLGELLIRLHKAALIISKLQITSQQLSQLMDKSSDTGWLNLTDLPVREGDIAVSFDRWIRLVKLFSFRDVLQPDQQDHLFDLFTIADEYSPGVAPFATEERRNYTAKLAEFTGWNKAEIMALVGKFDIGAISHGGGGILQARFPAHFGDERLPNRILVVVNLLKRLGVTTYQAHGWVTKSLNHFQQSRQVEQIKNSLQMRFDDGWSAIAKQLRDPLRERQREVLVAYLMHHWRLEREDDLFDHFLLDVEISPCMMTSRLIQATASVQLFVQRVLMGLEPGLYLIDEGAEQWEWMKNYRVWEANRKIFLYPENWIEPELRDDKTPFFKELENELMQADINNETAETAILHYLEKLNEVARLQVCGQYYEEDASILHVFARTRDVPHQYYYRELVMTKGNWTAWERVDVDIKSDHLIPVVYNRRVYLFWPIFSSRDEAPFTNITQQLMQVFSKILQLQTQLGTLVQGIFQGMGVAVIAGLTNGIIQLLEGLEAPGIDFTSIQNKVRKIRKDLLEVVGITESWIPDNQVEKEKFDDTTKVVEQLDLSDLGEVTDILQQTGDLLNSFEETLIKLLPAKLLEVQLAWSEYRNDSWSAKKTSSGVVSFRDVVSTFFESLPQLPGLGSEGVKRLFSFWGEINQHNQLIVHCNVALPASLFDSGNSMSAWLSEPVEIGYFRLNSCLGTLESFDTSENLGISDLVKQVVSQAAQQTDDMLQSLKDDRQLSQRGEPITPDDDPDRPSELRNDLDLLQLPKHYIPQLINGNEDIYRILRRHQYADDLYKQRTMFFYQNVSHTFFCRFFPKPPPENNPGSGRVGDPHFFYFVPFYHPYTCAFLENIQRFGIPGLYDVRFRNNGNILEPDGVGQPLQLVLKDDELFAREYYPVGNVYNPPDGDRTLRPVQEINFSIMGAYSQYNWELFFHIPLLIASRLNTNQKFSEAQHWFHYIFNPTDASRSAVPTKYWRTRPFVETAAEDYPRQEIEQLLQILSSEAESPGLQEIERAVQLWRSDAFNPHLVARTRTIALQKAVVMKYIDNLIAWGDSLFRRETREAINEAAQLYVLAAKLLGPRPRRLPGAARRNDYSFNELVEEQPLDAFSNSLVEIENYLPAQSAEWSDGDIPAIETHLGHLDRASLAQVGNSWRLLVKSRSMQNIFLKKSHPEKTEAQYFCVPPNDKLYEKWDITADRLFKIRHCQNISGQKLQLPLLSPPINPAILVRARAAGVGIDSVLGQLAASLPHYRFGVMAQKATELCGEVRSLGDALLSALEKRDGEALTLLRNTQEFQLLEAIEKTKEKQIEEAEEVLAGLKCLHQSAMLKRNYYQQLLDEFMNPEEVVNTTLNATSLMLKAGQFGLSWGASAASLIPNIKGGFVTTLGITTGGDNIKGSVENAVAAIGQMASIVSSTGSMVSTMGGYRRRADDWQFQIQQTEKELCDLETKVAAAEVRLEITKEDLNNHKLQIKNNRDSNEFMQKKFTNKELYDWMVSQISTLYFQSYQLAYDMAKKAERAFAFELGVENPGIIQYGYWDSLHKGLLAGDHLHHDIKRMEVAYLDRNKREYEITKNISLASLHPEGVLALQETGECFVDLPEAIFDLDHPGHYMRRIKAVSITIPCITGPYVSVPCKLTLLANRTRIDPQTTPQYSSTGSDDLRFQFNPGGIRSVVTSNGQNDPGAFEFNLYDDRYLPFEGAGVISSWRLQLPGTFRSFDYRTISDVILHIRFTARDGESILKDAVLATLEDTLRDIEVNDHAGLVQGFSSRNEFPDAWQTFAYMPDGQTGNPVLSMPVTKDHFPALIAGRSVKVTRLLVVMVLAKGVTYDDSDNMKLKLTPPNGVAQEFKLEIQNNRVGGLPMAEVTLSEPVPVVEFNSNESIPVPWEYELTHISANLAHTEYLNDIEISRIDTTKVIDMAVLYAYTV